MSLLSIRLQPGESIFTQVVHAAQKAIMLSQFLPGQPFPSVRVLAAELHIHPKTAHKIIQHLINEGWLQAQPGIGTVVAVPPSGGRQDRNRLLGRDMEELALEAKRLGVSFQELVHALSTHWNRIDEAGNQAVGR